MAAGSASAGPPPAGFDRAAWRTDYATLKRALEQSYANLAWFASPQGGVDLPALDRRTRRLLDLADSDDDARAAVLGFVAAFHDGHFSPLPLRLPAPAGAAEPATAALDPLDADAGCAALGYAVTRSTAFSLPFETLPGFALESDGIATPFRAGVLDAGNATRFGLVRIPYFRQSEAATLCVHAWTAQRQAGTAIDPLALRKQVDAAWFDALATQLRRFRQERVAAVIVDVGDNGGGNDAGDWAARLFTPKPVYSARLWMAAAADASSYAEEQLGELRKALAAEPTAGAAAQAAFAQAIEDFERRKAAVGARHCDLSWAWRERRAWQPAACSRLLDMGFASGALNYLPAAAFVRGELAAALYWPATVDAQRGAWDGPVYVLTSAKTYSSAEMFSAVMHDNGIARTVGVTTGGDGCGFMQESRALVLPHSLLRFRIPDCVRLRADGSDEVAGIQPDLPVLPAEGESDRARAVRMLALVATDLHAPKSHGDVR
ncbi:MAG: S41 family peptidase [Dokdonella sp.]